MKIAYLGNYLESSGYSSAERENILALDSVGVEVVPRYLRMTNSDSQEIPSRIRELEQGTLDNIDVVVQHNLPSEYSYKSGVQNIGFFSYETDSIPFIWHDHLNLMDKIIVSCKQQKDAMKKSCPNLVDRTYIVPFAVDTDKFDKQYEKMVFDIRPGQTPIKFYTIAEFGMRKNLAALIVSYYAAFNIDDNVVLIIKTHGQGSVESLQSMVNDLKKTMGRFSDPNLYPPIVLISSFLTDKQICSLHTTGDIYISSSRGEAFSIPFIEAMGFGNPCIAPNNTAFIDYHLDLDLLVSDNGSICFGVQGAPPGLYTADEIWGNPSLVDLKERMQYAYKYFKYITSETQSNERKETTKRKFNRQVIGNQLLEVINAK